MAGPARLDLLARLGYFARAVVYGLLGYLAINMRGQVAKGPEGEFELLRALPGGRAILIVLVAGLVAYGAYKLAASFLDIDHKGSEPRALLERIGIAAGALAYLAMAWVALRFAIGMGDDADGRSGSQETAASILEFPLGAVVLALAGIGFLVAAGFQLHSAWTRRFMRTIAADAPPLTCTLGRIGLSVRSVVFAIVGWSLVQGAIRREESEVRDLGGALRELQDAGTLYLIVAVGLIIFAIFSAIEARYRIVPPIDAAQAGRQKLTQKLDEAKN